MSAKKLKKNKAITRVIVIAALIAVVGFVVWQSFLKPADIPNTIVKQSEDTTKDAPIADPSKRASDETLGSGFAVEYPDGWTNVHTGASQPQSTQQGQTDENIITSPSGKIQVALTIRTLAHIGGACSDGYIALKYLNVDTEPLLAYSEGRFAAYVVYFPDFNLYQYHVGLQKNTAAIQGVTLENDMACNFMFSEFIERNSSLPNVPVTTTTLSIKFPDLVSRGQDLKTGISEAHVADKLSGAEYEQAKAIVQSVHITK